jgi:hypothetical protein
MSTITESKKETLMDLLHQLENDITSLFQSLDEYQTISNDKFKVYEKQIECLYALHNQITEEVLFS